jgi:hypothetical protein
MHKTNFISGVNSENSDFEKLFFYVFNEAIQSFISNLERRKQSIIISSIVLVLGIPLVFVEGIVILGVIMIIAGITALPITIYRFNNLRLNSKLNKIGLINIPILHANLHKKSILVDLSNLTEHSVFEFPSLNIEQLNSFNQENQSIKSLVNNYPIIISPNKEKEIQKVDSNTQNQKPKIYTEEIELLDKSNNISYLLNNPQKQKVSIPALKKNEPLVNYLKGINLNGNSYSLENLDALEIHKNIKSIDGIVDISNKEKETTDIDKLCIELKEEINRIIPRYKYVMNSSLNNIMSKSQLLMNYQLYNISNNYYCPKCNKEELEQIESGRYIHNADENEKKVIFKKNTRLKLVDFSQLKWKCPLCEEETNHPIIRNKLDDELFTPVYDKLFDEHFKERLDIYNSINDQKRQYSEKASSQFHQVLRENRTKEDSIKSHIRTITAEINAEQTAISRLNDLLLKYDRIDKDRAKQIEEDIENIKENVNIENDRAKNEIKQTISEAKNEIEASTEKYATLEREDKAKRDAVQKQMIKDMKAIREIEEIRAEREGMNNGKGPFGIFESERERIKK